MKLPERPPKVTAAFWNKLTPEQAQAIFVPDQEIKEFHKKINAQYYYWDKFKQLSIPKQSSPKDAWICLKMARNSSRQNIPLQDLEGKNFSFYITATMQSYLSKIDQYAAGNLSLADQDNISVQHNERYIISSLMEEGIASSQLEGAVETRKKAKHMLMAGKKPENHHQRMIANNYQTILKIRNEWSREKLSADLISQIHKSMSQGTLDAEEEEGRFRGPSDDIHVIDEEQNILFVPPASEKIDGMVQQLCIFANTEHENENFIHPVVKAIIIHFWLAYIHPFTDGNGRTARALFYWYVLSKKYWLFEFLSISRIILNASKKYWRAFLYTEYDECDLNYFLQHQIVAVNEALEDLLVYLRKKRQEEAQVRLIREKNKDLNERQTILMVHALKHREYAYTVKEHMTRCDIVYETARKDLMELAEKGYLDLFESEKEFKYRPIANLPKKLKIV